jgi:hypothetical protein
MTGQVAAFALALTAPRDPVTVGTDVSLSGLAAPGTELVAVQRRDADGAFTLAATAGPSADGRFQATVPAVTSADYRALVGSAESPLVHVAVAPRVTLAVRREAPRVQLIGSASPSQKGLPGVLQVYSRERFTWVRYLGFRFDAHSQVRLTLSTRRPLRLRLVLLRATTGFVGGTSNTVSLTERRDESVG